MFQYPSTAEGPNVQPAPPPVAPQLGVGMALAAARRHAGLMIFLGLIGAVAAYSASFVLTPKYTATTELYIDPGASQSATADPITPGADSNSFVAYVESQALLIKSRSVMERVARAEALDHDPEFSADAPTSLFSAFGRSGAANDALTDPVTAAARSFSSHVDAKRTERTYVLDITVTSLNADHAAKLANATAQAYMEEVSRLRDDGARQTGAAIAQKLESLRGAVIKAEQAKESYKSDKGLVGARDVTLLEQQLRNLEDQITAQRAKESDAKARVESAQGARVSDGDLGVFASQFGLMTLSQLRGQQAEARQRLADTLADLGPRHPTAIEAQARLEAANKAVEAELERFARAQRLEYQRAKSTEADLQRQLDTLKKQTHSDDQAMVGLRDLERKAQAARDIYELFVTRSRDTGEIQEVAPIRTKVITVAAAPKNRTFPPSGTMLALLGFAGGLALGFLIALFRETSGQAAPAGAAMGRHVEPPFAAAQAIRRAPAAFSHGPAPQPFEPEARGPTPGRPEPHAPAAFGSEPARSGPPVHAAFSHRAAPREPFGSAPAPAPDAAALTAARNGKRRRRPAWRKHFLVGAGSISSARTRRQTLDQLDLTGLGFATLASKSDAREFSLILDGLPNAEDGRHVVVVTGANENDERTSLAINLALAATREGGRVALIDAAGRNAKLTRAVRRATLQAVLDGGPGFETDNGVLLVLPKAGETGRGRIRPLQALEELVVNSGREFDLILCDGPDASELGASEVFAAAEAIVTLDDQGTLDRLEDLGFAPTAQVHFETDAQTLRRA